MPFSFAIVHKTCDNFPPRSMTVPWLKNSINIFLNFFLLFAVVLFNWIRERPAWTVSSRALLVWCRSVLFLCLLWNHWRILNARRLHSSKSARRQFLKNQRSSEFSNSCLHHIGHALKYTALICCKICLFMGQFWWSRKTKTIKMQQILQRWVRTLRAHF